MYSWIQTEKSLYYQAHLIKDLFGDWTLVSSWGSIDARRGRVRTTGVSSYEAGLERIKAIDRRRRQHGYQCVQGLSTSPTGEKRR
ncbi:WGR domain-containing protein [Thiocystis violascens]|uniref:WGR domain-containing protein n=1 Tax=Thiocystis violascens (strain ATCC 17096 / DSM 198 / 6111) TaxID=765911 RepID=I3Y704_THIV6|nr:WGR domain-containing protein [Thiocystis violascens]AFL72772.1 hypothetical protein Thivi_0719 [Thiocystis violascens DSM 198]